MKVDRKQVEYVAELARIELDEEEKAIYSDQLSTILAFFDRLEEVDTKDVPPTSHVLDLVNALRPDDIRTSLSVDEGLKNAPDRKKRFFRVPRILD